MGTEKSKMAATPTDISILSYLFYKITLLTVFNFQNEYQIKAVQK